MSTTSSVVPHFLLRKRRDSNVICGATMLDEWTQRAIFSLDATYAQQKLTFAGDATRSIGYGGKRYLVALFVAYRVTGDEVFKLELLSICRILLANPEEWDISIDEHASMGVVGCYCVFAFLSYVTCKLGEPIMSRKFYNKWRAWQREEESDDRESVWKVGRRGKLGVRWKNFPHVVACQLLMACSLSLRFPEKDEFQQAYSQLSTHFRSLFEVHPQVHDGVAWRSPYKNVYSPTVYSNYVVEAVALIKFIDSGNKTFDDTLMKKFVKTFSFVIDPDEYNYEDLWQTIAINEEDIQNENSNWEWRNMGKSRANFWCLSVLQNFEADGGVIHQATPRFYSLKKTNPNGVVIAAWALTKYSGFFRQEVNQ